MATDATIYSVGMVGVTQIVYTIACSDRDAILSAQAIAESVGKPLASVFVSAHNTDREMRQAYHVADNGDMPECNCGLPTGYCHESDCAYMVWVNQFN